MVFSQADPPHHIPPSNDYVRLRATTHMPCCPFLMRHMSKWGGWISLLLRPLANTSISSYWMVQFSKCTSSSSCVASGWVVISVDTKQIWTNVQIKHANATSAEVRRCHLICSLKRPLVSFWSHHTVVLVCVDTVESTSDTSHSRLAWVRRNSTCWYQAAGKRKSPSLSVLHHTLYNLVFLVLCW